MPTEHGMKSGKDIEVRVEKETRCRGADGADGADEEQVVWSS